MIDVWLDTIWLAFVLMATLVGVLLALGAVVMAGWMVWGHLRNRNMEPQDPYTLLRPRIRRRSNIAPRVGGAIGSERSLGTISLGEMGPDENLYAQEKLPF